VVVHFCKIVHAFSSASLSMITVWTFCLASLSVVRLKLLHEGCTPSCYAALNSFKTAFGCCVNFYNNSIYGNYRNTTNPDLWSACGIPTPGFCTSTLSS